MLSSCCLPVPIGTRFLADQSPVGRWQNHEARFCNFRGSEGHWESLVPHIMRAATVYLRALYLGCTCVRYNGWNA